MNASPPQIRARARWHDSNPYAGLAKGSAQATDRFTAVKVFTIPSCDEGVTLFGPEIELVATRDFQRLGFIRQLGTSSVVFRGAVHTRFEHSLGTLHMSERIIQAARRNPAGTDEARDLLDEPSAHRLARLAGLLHDLTHVPFGHTLEDEFGLLQRHDENDHRAERFFGPESEVARILVETIGAHEYKELCQVLKAKEETIPLLDRPFLADIMGNTVCADILDYVRRDLDACGMEVALGERFLDYFTITSKKTALEQNRLRMALILDKRGMPRPDVESEVVKLLTFRYELAERVYFHHAKNAASVMIARAVQTIGLARGPRKVPGAEEASFDDAKDENFYDLSDDLLLRILKDPSLAGFYELNHKRGLSDEEWNLSVALADGVLSRNVYKLAYLAVRDDLPHGAASIYARYGSPKERLALEDRLAGMAGLPQGSVLVHLPRPQMMRKRADVRVILADHRTVTTLGEWDELHSRRIESLNAAHQGLWRVGVYLEPGYMEQDAPKHLVQAAAQDIFGAPSRYQVNDAQPYYETVWGARGGELNWPDEARAEVLGELRETEPAAWDGVTSLGEAARIVGRKVRAWKRRNA